jgi:hypothetical protein
MSFPYFSSFLFIQEVLDAVRCWYRRIQMVTPLEMESDLAISAIVAKLHRFGTSYLDACDVLIHWVKLMAATASGLVAATATTASLAGRVQIIIDRGIVSPYFSDGKANSGNKARVRCGYRCTRWMLFAIQVAYTLCHFSCALVLFFMSRYLQAASLLSFLARFIFLERNHRIINIRKNLPSLIAAFAQSKSGVLHDTTVDFLSALLAAVESDPQKFYLLCFNPSAKDPKLQSTIPQALRATVEDRINTICNFPNLAHGYMQKVLYKLDPSGRALTVFDHDLGDGVPCLSAAEPDGPDNQNGGDGLVFGAVQTELPSMDEMQQALIGTGDVLQQTQMMDLDETATFPPAAAPFASGQGGPRASLNDDVVFGTAVDRQAMEQKYREELTRAQLTAGVADQQVNVMPRLSRRDQLHSAGLSTADLQAHPGSSTPGAGAPNTDARRSMRAAYATMPAGSVAFLREAEHSLSLDATLPVVPPTAIAMQEPRSAVGSSRSVDTLGSLTVTQLMAAESQASATRLQPAPATDAALSSSMLSMSQLAVSTVGGEPSRVRKYGFRRSELARILSSLELGKDAHLSTKSYLDDVSQGVSQVYRIMDIHEKSVLAGKESALTSRDLELGSALLERTKGAVQYMFQQIRLGKAQPAFAEMRQGLKVIASVMPLLSRLFADALFAAFGGNAATTRSQSARAYDPVWALQLLQLVRAIVSVPTMCNPLTADTATPLLSELIKRTTDRIFLNRQHGTESLLQEEVKKTAQRLAVFMNRGIAVAVLVRFLLAGACLEPFGQKAQPSWTIDTYVDPKTSEVAVDILRLLHNEEMQLAGRKQGKNFVPYDLSDMMAAFQSLALFFEDQTIGPRALWLLLQRPGSYAELEYVAFQPLGPTQDQSYITKITTIATELGKILPQGFTHDTVSSYACPIILRAVCGVALILREIIKATGSKYRDVAATAAASAAESNEGTMGRSVLLLYMDAILDSMRAAQNLPPGAFVEGMNSGRSAGTPSTTDAASRLGKGSLDETVSGDANIEVEYVVAAAARPAPQSMSLAALSVAATPAVGRSVSRLSATDAPNPAFTTGVSGPGLFDSAATMPIGMGFGRGMSSLPPLLGSDAENNAATPAKSPAPSYGNSTAPTYASQIMAAFAESALKFPAVSQARDACTSLAAACGPILLQSLREQGGGASPPSGADLATVEAAARTDPASAAFLTELGRWRVLKGAEDVRALVLWDQIRKQLADVRTQHPLYALAELLDARIKQAMLERYKNGPGGSMMRA